jgi:hypothetical protein
LIEKGADSTKEARARGKFNQFGNAFTLPVTASAARE